MGGMLCSDMTIYNVLVEENLRKYKQALTVLEIPEPEAKKLFEYFFRCDEDNSGQISIKEFFDFVGASRLVVSRLSGERMRCAVERLFVLSPLLEMLLVRVRVLALMPFAHPNQPLCRWPC